MNKEYIFSKIINIPKDFHERGDISVIELLRESGYLLISSPLSIQEILSALKREIQLAYEWLIYSESQRSEKCWYFRQINSKWEVNYYPSIGIEKQKIYDNFLEACAAYIQLEVTSIAQYL